MSRSGKAVVCALSAACGMFAGLWLGGEASDGSEIPGPNTRGISERRRADETHESEAHGFKRTLARIERAGGLPESAMDAVERADTHILRDWMRSLAGERIDARDFRANRRRCRMLAAISKELYRREDAESVRWAMATADNLLVLCVLSELAREDLPAAMKWLPAYVEKYQFPANPVFQAAAEGAATRGAGELLELEKSGFSDSLVTRYADDFDFRTYLTNTTSTRGREQAVRCWAAKDPDAVERMLSDRPGEVRADMGRLLKQAYQGRSAMVGETEAARWIWPILRALSPGERALVYPQIWRGESELDLGLWDAAADDSERAELLSSSPHVADDGRVDRWLDRIDSEELRAKTMERWSKKRRALPSPAVEP